MVSEGGVQAPPPHKNKPSIPQVSRGWRTTAILLIILVTALGITLFAVINPFGAGTPGNIGVPRASAGPTGSPNPSSTRPPYQFPPVSESQTPGSQQCPDAGSVGAGESDIKTEVLEIKDERSADVRLLGPNRRVVIAKNAVMTGAVTLCGDGATVLIIGSLTGPVLMQGSGVKIVVQDAGEEKLPPAYSTTNGRVIRCSTNKKERAVPQCADFAPRPGAKPNG